MLLIAAAAATAGAFATLPASAQDAPTPPPPPEAGTPAPKPERPLNIRAQIMFNLVDVNGDGAIDQTEIAALQKAIFTAIDADKDGKLTQEEFRNMMSGGERGPRAGRGGPDGGPGWHRHGPRGPEAGPRGHRGDEFRNQRGGPRGEDFRGPRGGRDRHGNLEEQMMPGQGPDGGRQVGAMEQDETAPRNFASLDVNSDGAVTPDEFAKGAPVLPFLPQ
jgi:Ca2+-binding EF-hand superfamily protein